MILPIGPTGCYPEVSASTNQLAIRLKKTNRIKMNGVRNIAMIMLTVFAMNLQVSAREIPLVYNTESSVSPFEVCLPSLEELPLIETLPDPFAWSDGSGRSTRFEDWGRRRMEIGMEIQH